MLNEIDLSRIDLNLLVLFETVLKEQHVGRAAERLHLSASAVSHGIGRLRQTFNDPLFLKHPKGVVPTARALAMAEPVALILAHVRQVVASADPFDPKRSKRRFVIGAPDALAVVAIPMVLAAISKGAPGVSVSAKDMLPADTPAALDAREIDVALYPLEDVPARFEARFLYEDDFVIAARADHALGKRASLENYCRARHLLVSHTGDPHGFVDDELERHGRSRTIALTVPSFMFALATIAETDLIGTVPRSLLRVHAARFGLATVEPPLPFGHSTIRAIAPKVAMMDDGIAWLLDLLQQLLSQPRRTRRVARPMSTGSR
jgi:DNA-binding transcriptional LysR family regulator